MKSLQHNELERFAKSVLQSLPSYFRSQRKRFSKEGVVPRKMLLALERLVAMQRTSFAAAWLYVGSHVSFAQRKLTKQQLLGVGQCVTLLQAFFQVSALLKQPVTKNLFWRELLQMVPARIPKNRKQHTAESFGIVLSDILMALALECLNNSGCETALVIQASGVCARAISQTGVRSFAVVKEKVVERAALYSEIGMILADVPREKKMMLLRALNDVHRGGSAKISRIPEGDSALLSAGFAFYRS